MLPSRPRVHVFAARCGPQPFGQIAAQPVDGAAPPREAGARAASRDAGHRRHRARDGVLSQGAVARRWRVRRGRLGRCAGWGAPTAIGSGSGRPFRGAPLPRRARACLACTWPIVPAQVGFRRMLLPDRTCSAGDTARGGRRYATGRGQVMRMPRASDGVGATIRRPATRKMTSSTGYGRDATRYAAVLIVQGVRTYTLPLCSVRLPPHRRNERNATRSARRRPRNREWLGL